MTPTQKLSLQRHLLRLLTITERSWGLRSGMTVSAAHRDDGRCIDGNHFPAIRCHYPDAIWPGHLLFNNSLTARHWLERHTS